MPPEVTTTPLDQNKTAKVFSTFNFPVDLGCTEITEKNEIEFTDACWRNCAFAWNDLLQSNSEGLDWYKPKEIAEGFSERVQQYLQLSGQLSKFQIQGGGEGLNPPILGDFLFISLLLDACVSSRGIFHAYVIHTDNDINPRAKETKAVEDFRVKLFCLDAFFQAATQAPSKLSCSPKEYELSLESKEAGFKSLCTKLLNAFADNYCGPFLSLKLNWQRVPDSALQVLEGFHVPGSTRFWPPEIAFATRVGEIEFVISGLRKFDTHNADPSNEENDPTVFFSSIEVFVPFEGKMISGRLEGTQFAKILEKLEGHSPSCHAVARRA